MIDVLALVLLIALLFVAVLLAFTWHDTLHPVFIFVAPISIGYAIYFALFRTHDLHPVTNALLVLSCTALLLGHLAMAGVATRPRLNPSAPITRESLAPLQSVARAFLAIGALGWVLGALQAYGYGSAGPSTSFFLNIRYHVTAEGEGLGVAAYLLLFLHIGFLLALAARGSAGTISRTAIVFAGMALLTSTLFTLARTQLLLYLVSGVGTYLLSSRFLHHRKAPVKWIIGTGAIGGVLLFSTLGLLAGKLLTGGAYFLLAYLGRPILAFDEWILEAPGRTGGYRTFYPLFRLLDVAGVLDSPPPPVQLSRDMFNVFTFMKDPYLDYGTLGPIVVSFAIGLLVTYIYRKARTGSPYWIVYYSLMLYPLAIAFFAYQF